MKIIKTVSQMRKLSLKWIRQGKSVGLISTMGALHKGHRSLIKQSREENDISVLSIFVNPVQFGQGEDYKKYPRCLQKDKRLAEKEGVEIIFAPSVEEMYPQGYLTFVNVENLSSVLCGNSRAGHFKGVCTVVNKLFNIIKPTRAYFGQKDYQQLKIIERMTKDLNLNVAVIMMPIVREENGLAISSRNSYLSGEERRQAPVLFNALKKAEEMIRVKKETDSAYIINQMEHKVRSQSKAKIDYIKICEPESLKEIEKISGEVLVLLAVWIGKTRLIDNFLIKGDE